MQSKRYCNFFFPSEMFDGMQMDLPFCGFFLSKLLGKHNYLDELPSLDSGLSTCSLSLSSLSPLSTLARLRSLNLLSLSTYSLSLSALSLCSLSLSFSLSLSRALSLPLYLLSQPTYSLSLPLYLLSGSLYACLSEGSMFSNMHCLCLFKRMCRICP